MRAEVEIADRWSRCACVGISHFPACSDNTEHLDHPAANRKGHFYKDSPDNICDYDDTDPSHDDCIYCHESYERK